MKRSFLLFLFFFTLLAGLQAQNESVYDYPLDSIKYLVEERPDAYDQIAATFHNDIDTSTWAEMTILYYGSAYRPNYNPYGEKSKTDEIWELLEEEEYENAMNKIAELHNDEPANLTALRQKAYCYAGMEDSVMAEKYFEKYYRLLSIPYHSGNGESADSAFVVRSVDDEYAIVYAMEGRVVAQELVEVKDHSYDVLTVALSDKEQFELWFNIDQPFKIGLINMFGGLGSEATNKTLTKKEKRKRKKELKKELKEKRKAAKKQEQD